MSLLLGCIADDFTGATDLANTLVKQGMPTVQLIGVPEGDSLPEGARAVVIALKSRTIEPQEAVRQSLAALAWIQRQGAKQTFFKYCSTFDSTDRGNIGPVADALLEAQGGDFTIACPAFPTTGRTIYLGHLFVGAQLLSESGMKDHPLTPMTDPDLVRVLGRQTSHGVGLIAHPQVDAGVDAVRAAIAGMRAEGTRFAVVDALYDRDLLTIGEACADLAMITGGSGIALGLPENFRRQGLLETGENTEFRAPDGPAAILSGSCSVATRGQVAHFKRSGESLMLDAERICAGEDLAGEALDWARARLGEKPVLIYSTDDPEAVGALQARFGREAAGEKVEQTMARIAQGLVDAGVRRLVVAGGETSGAAVGALGVKALRIGNEIDPGVPWTLALGDPPIALALKSGNFGAEDFFTKSFALLT